MEVEVLRGFYYRGSDGEMCRADVGTLIVVSDATASVMCSAHKARRLDDGTAVPIESAVDDAGETPEDAA